MEGSEVERVPKEKDVELETAATTKTAAKRRTKTGCLSEFFFEIPYTHAE